MFDMTTSHDLFIAAMPVDLTPKVYSCYDSDHVQGIIKMNTTNLM